MGSRVRVASDPPAHAGGFYGSVSDGMPSTLALNCGTQHPPGNLWPSFSRFVARYRSLNSCTGGRIGT